MSCPQLGLTAPHSGTNSNISTRTREGQLLTRKWAKDQNIRKSKGRALLRKKCVTLGCDFPRGNEILSLQNSDTPSGRRVSLCCAARCPSSLLRTGLSGGRTRSYQSASPFALDSRAPFTRAHGTCHRAASWDAEMDPAGEQTSSLVSVALTL